MAGYACCDALDWSPEIGISLASAPLIAALILAWKSRQHRWMQTTWMMLFCMSVFLLAMSYHRLRLPAANWPEGLPPREAILTVKVYRIFQGSSQANDSGIARIQESPDHLPYLRQQWLFVSVPKDMGGLHRQEVIQVKGQLEYLPPGKPDSFEAFLHQQGIHLKLYRITQRDIRVTQPVWLKVIDRLRLRTRVLLTAGIEAYQIEADIYRAMLLGEKGLIDPDNKEHFIQTGTFHLFAISGLHVGIIAISLVGLAQLLRIPHPFDSIMVLGVLFAYVQMTGASPSSIRAFSMVFFIYLARKLRRQSLPLHGLIASACCSLILDPRELHSAGFQMSYTVVAGIILWGLPLEKQWRKKLKSLSKKKTYFQARPSRILISTLNKIAMAVAVSLSAFFASAPLSIQYFQILAPGAIPLNIVLVPLASLTLIAGFLSGSLGLLAWSSASVFLNHGPVLLIRLMLATLYQAGEFPGAFLSLTWPHPAMGPVLALTFILALLAYPRQRRTRWDFHCFPLVFGMLSCIVAASFITVFS